MTPVVIGIDVTGEKRVEQHLLGMGARSLNAAPILEVIAGQLKDVEEDRFAAQGPGWAPLKPATVARKAALGLNPKILQATERLRRSLVEDSPDHVEIVTTDTLIFGTRVPYAIFHQYGTRFMPKRAPVELHEGHVRGITRSIQAYIVGLDRAEFGVGDFGVASLDPFGLA